MVYLVGYLWIANLNNPNLYRNIVTVEKIDPLLGQADCRTHWARAGVHSHTYTRVLWHANQELECSKRTPAHLHPASSFNSSSSGFIREVILANMNQSVEQRTTENQTYLRCSLLFFFFSIILEHYYIFLRKDLRTLLPIYKHFRNLDLPSLNQYSNYVISKASVQPYWEGLYIIGRT